VYGAAQIAAQVLPAILSGVEHGSHLCAFYETKDDLIDLVLPFFDAGLNQGELCVWMMPDYVSEQEAAAVAAKRIIEFYPGRALYMNGPRFRTWADRQFLERETAVGSRHKLFAHARFR
jgi:hypothetical protein